MTRATTKNIYSNLNASSDCPWQWRFSRDIGSIHTTKSNDAMRKKSVGFTCYVNSFSCQLFKADFGDIANEHFVLTCCNRFIRHNDIIRWNCHWLSVKFIESEWALSIYLRLPLSFWPLASKPLPNAGINVQVDSISATVNMFRNNWPIIFCRANSKSHKCQKCFWLTTLFFVTQFELILHLVASKPIDRVLL